MPQQTRAQAQQAQAQQADSSALRGETRCDVGVPLYVYPTADRLAWVRPLRFADRIRFVIVNAADGPGVVVDENYRYAIDRLRAGRVLAIGYVDTDYGRRPVEDVVADATAWVRLYGVRGVFLDQVAGDFAHLDHYAACAIGARAAGAQFVVVNPGTDCHPGYADLANVTVTFEGDWQQYQSFRPAGWTAAFPASRFCHLVFAVPYDLIEEGPALAAARHARTAFFTDGEGANPWDRLPLPVLEAAGRPPEASEASARGAPPPPPARSAPPAPAGWPRRTYAAAGQLPEAASRPAKSLHQ